MDNVTIGENMVMPDQNNFKIFVEQIIFINNFKQL